MEEKENAASAVASTDVEAAAADGQRGEGHRGSEGPGGRTPERPQAEQRGRVPAEGDDAVSPSSDEPALRLVAEVGRLAGAVAGLCGEVAEQRDEISGLRDEIAGLRGEVSKLEGELRRSDEKAEAKPSVEPMWTRQNVADYLQSSLRFVDSLIADNQLVGVQIGALKRFDRRTVEALVRNPGNPRLRRVQGNKKKAA